MSLTPRFLDELKSRVAVSDVIGRAIKITKAGREYKACCPFHSEKSPSFTINDDKGFYHCFGCGAHGDVIGFVQQYQNMSFIEAVEQLCPEAGLDMPKPDPKAAAKAERNKDLHALLEDTTQFFQAQLRDHKNRAILDYARSRGMTDDDINNFRIGFAPHDRNVVRTYLKQQGYTDKDMIAAGVVKASSRGGDPYAFFNERLMFPVTDRQGRVIAFGGRALPDHLQAPSYGDYMPPKYLNSGDTQMFDKSRIVYAYTKARMASGQGQPILVTEGYMDVIACHRAGFTGAIAPMGTALTEEQVTLIWKMMADDDSVKTPILCFDGDNAGRKAAVRALDRIMPLLQPGVSAKFAFMPDGKDPDDLLQDGGAPALQAVLDRSLSLIDFLWRVHTHEKDTQTPESRARITQDIRNAIAKIGHADVQAHYKTLINQRISDTFFARQSDNRSYGGYNKKPRSPRQKLKPRKPNRFDAAQKILLACIINHPHIYHDVEEDLAVLHFQHDGLQALCRALPAIIDVEPPPKPGDIHDALYHRGFERELDAVCNQSVYLHGGFAAPKYDGADVLSQWRALFNAMQEQSIPQEIRDGWQNALNENDESAEQSVRAMMGDVIVD